MIKPLKNINEESEITMTTKKGLFITVEGLEGAGKSTVIQFIQNYLLLHNVELVVTREPGGTEIAEAIRHLLLSYYEEKMAEDTELLLFYAGRAQHIASVIKPALDAGKVVLCDRFSDTSFAYQGGGRGIPEERLAILDHWVLGDLKPDLTLFLDVPIEVGMQRIKKRGACDRIESEELAFFERVRAAYLERAERYADRYRIIDTTPPWHELEPILLNFLNRELLNNIHDY